MPLRRCSRWQSPRARNRRSRHATPRSIAAASLTRLTPPRIAELRRAERGWITARKRHCDLAAKEGEGGSIATLLYGQCMIDETVRRTLWLERIAK